MRWKCRWTQVMMPLFYPDTDQTSDTFHMHFRFSPFDLPKRLPQVWTVIEPKVPKTRFKQKQSDSAEQDFLLGKQLLCHWYWYHFPPANWFQEGATLICLFQLWILGISPQKNYSNHLSMVHHEIGTVNSNDQIHLKSYLIFTILVSTPS